MPLYNACNFVKQDKLFDVEIFARGSIHLRWPRSVVREDEANAVRRTQAGSSRKKADEVSFLSCRQGGGRVRLLQRVDYGASRLIRSIRGRRDTLAMVGGDLSWISSQAGIHLEGGVE
jgi:hypothetical protein